MKKKNNTHSLGIATNKTRASRKFIYTIEFTLLSGINERVRHRTEDGMNIVDRYSDKCRMLNGMAVTLGPQNHIELHVRRICVQTYQNIDGIKGQLSNIVMMRMIVI